MKKSIVALGILFFAGSGALCATEPDTDQPDRRVQHALPAWPGILALLAAAGTTWGCYKSSQDHEYYKKLQNQDNPQVPILQKTMAAQLHKLYTLQKEHLPSWQKREVPDFQTVLKEVARRPEETLEQWVRRLDELDRTQVYLSNKQFVQVTLDDNSPAWKKIIEDGYAWHKDIKSHTPDRLRALNINRWCFRAFMVSVGFLGSYWLVRTLTKKKRSFDPAFALPTPR